MKRSIFRKSILILISLFSLLFVYSACDSWMSDDDGFYEEIESEVKRANATVVNVYVRYAATKMGKTDPDGYAVFKVDIPSTVSATTETDYGFKKWAAFPTSFIEPGDTQYTNLVYEDDASYASKYGAYELSSEVVTFADPYSSTTEVTVNEERNDIYLVPVVAKRPTIALTMPSSGSSGIVRNMTVRINFTKAMNPDSFKDAAGNFDKITVTQGTQSITSDGDIEISSDEITNRFAAPTFSTNGKMVTLKFNEQSISEGFSAQSYVTINISKEVTDIYGYSMAEDLRLQFQVGSSFDTLAPRITELTAGVGNSFNSFAGIYKDEKTVSNLGSFTRMTLDGASKADSNVDNAVYTEKVLSQRIKDKINIRILAEDIAGSGSGQDQTGVESDVSMIGIRATNLIKMDGSASPADSILPIKSLAYVAQTNNSEIKGSYRDITGENKGYLFTYDLSTLPDGLIKVDVWAYDSIGNNGLMDGGSYSSEYGNGYASIIVVKDTTAPDAVANAAKVISYSKDAPYRWYSAATLGSMIIYQETAGAVVDAGHPKLRAKDTNLQWIFNVTDKTDWGSELSPSDERWKKVESGYTITNASIPEKEGPVAISFVLKDDLNNISSVVPLNSIMYDNTPVSVTVPTWVKADGSLALNASLTAKVENSILKIPFADNLSGAKRLELRISKDGKEVEAPVAVSTYKYTDKADVVPSSSEDLGMDTADTATTNNVLVFNKTLSGGVVYVQNLTIGEEDGIYTVAVNLYDNALNKSETKSTTISRDTTAPKVVDDSIKVNEIFESTSYEGVTRNWLKKEVYDDTRTPNKASITFTVNETGSGIRNIKFSGGTVSFTNESVIKVNGTALVRGDDTSKSDYKLDLAANTVTLYDSYSPKIFGEAAVVTIENVRFGVVNNVAANIAKIVLTDFVENNSSEAKSPEVFADTENPSIAVVTMLDRNKVNAGNNEVDAAYEVSQNKYTDEQLVTLQVIPASNEKDRGIGIKTLRLRDAIFTPETQCIIAGKQVSASFVNETVTFTNPITDISLITFTNVKFLTEENEVKQIDVTPEDYMGWTGEKTLSNTIIFDNKKPEITGALSWVTETGALALNSSKTVKIEDSILRIPFADSLSGVKRLAMTIRKASTNVEEPNAMEEITVRYSADSAVKPNGATPLTLAASDIEGLSTARVLTLKDAAGNDVTLNGGVLYVKGIKIGDTDGIYNVSVNLFDNSINKSAARETTTAKDTTAPVITGNSVTVNEILESTSYEGVTKYWVKPEAYDANRIPNKLSLTFTVSESGSGIKKIELTGGMAVLTSNSILKVNGIQLVEGDAPVIEEFTETTTPDYKLNVADNTIILHNSYFPKIYKADSSETTTVTIENVEFKNINTAASNKVQIAVTDFVDNVSVVGVSADIYAENTNPEVTSVVISDRDSAMFESKSTNYTNSLNIDLSTTFQDQTAVCSSGVRTLVFTNARFLKDASPSVIKLGGNVFSQYSVSEDGTEITFNKPFDSQTTLVFENIQITQSVLELGSKAVSVTVKDINNWTSAPAASNSICYDNTAPVTGNLSWIPSTGDAGYSNSNVLNSQTLNIPFTESPAGLKTILLEITQPDGTSYGSLFADSGLTITYTDSGNNAVTLVKDTDYTISGQTITFNAPKMTGTVSIKNLVTSDVNTEGVFTVKATLRDIAENSDANSIKSVTLINDKTSPVVEKIEIPGLKKAIELVKGVTAKGTKDGTSGEYWLSSEYIGGDHGGNYAATLGKAYITINEVTSGVSLITIGGTTQLQDTSKLYMVAADGTETPVDASKYTVDTTANTIKINTPSDSLKGNTSFVILIDNLKFTKNGGDGTDTATAHNTISVTVKDVSLNESDTNSTITLKGKTATTDSFWTDSWHCGLNTLYLEDADTFAGTAGNRSSTPGYTNDEHITLTVSMKGEDKGASGHNKFVLTGAEFTNSTTIRFSQSSNIGNVYDYIKNKNTTYSDTIPSDKFIISTDASGKNTIIELKDSSENYYVFRNITGISFTNVKIDNTSDGMKDVSIVAYDLAGWNSDTKTTQITLDKTSPTWRYEKGAFAAAKECDYISGRTVRYDPAVSVYPHPNNETAFGVDSPTNEKNKDGNTVYYFYTSAKYWDDQKHIANTAASYYGVVLGIGGLDANLFGYENKNGIPCVIADTTGVAVNTIDASYVMANGTVFAKDINGNTTWGGNTNEPGWKTVLNAWVLCQAGHTYSAVILDEAGNCSEKAMTFKIVQDTTQPSVKVSNGTTSLSSTFSIIPPSGSQVFRNESPSQQDINSLGGKSYGDLYDDYTHQAKKYFSTNYVIKKSDERFKIKISLNGIKTTELASTETYLDGSSIASNSLSYSETVPGTTDSGLEAYSISHWYADWTAYSSDEAGYLPAFPSDTVTPEKKSMKDYFGWTLTTPDNDAGHTSNASWHTYEKSSSRYKDSDLWSYVDASGNIIIELRNNADTPPLALMLKDHCGNLNYILIRPASMETDGKKTINFTVDNKLGNQATDGNGRTTARVVTQLPNFTPSTVTGEQEWGAGCSWGPYSYKADDSDAQSGVSKTGRIVRNNITKTTYYNNNPKLILAVDSAEQIKFGDTDSKPIKGYYNNDPSKYSGRARLYCTQGDAPDYATIANAATSAANGITDWNYCSAGNAQSNLYFVFDYPHPTVFTGAYHIYYIVEDYVGNFEIATVVNADGTTSKDVSYDWWLYDNDAPVITVRGTNTSPASISKDQASTLLPNNNGYRAYSDGSVVWLSIKDDDKHLVPRGTNLQNKSEGPGTTRHVEGFTDTTSNSRRNLMFFDIEVHSESTGIRAFCYSTSSTSPGLTDPVSDANTQGDNASKVWYAGYGALQIDACIGCNWTYSTDNANRYDTSTDLYTGTKVNTVFPWARIPDSDTGGPIFLHVMDWTGNIATYRMGDFLYKNDLKAPENVTGASATKVSVAGSHYMEKTDTSAQNLRISGLVSGSSSSKSDITIEVPATWYTEAGSGVYGYTMSTTNDISVAGRSNNKPALTVGYDTYSTWSQDDSSATGSTYYIFDNVGNRSSKSFNGYYDTQRPALVTTVVPLSGKYLFDPKAVPYETKQSSKNFRITRDTLYTNLTDVQAVARKVYINGSKVKFNINTISEDFASCKYKRWESGSWIASYDFTSMTTGSAVTATKDEDNNNILYSGTNKYYETDTLDPTYFCFIMTDLLGHSTYQYFEIIKDIWAPNVTTDSIEFVNQVSDINYINSRSKAKIKYEDQAGLASYRDVSGTTIQTNSYTPATDLMEITLSNFTPDAGTQQILFEATDNLGSSSNPPLKYLNKDKWVIDTTAPTFTPIANQNIVKKGNTGSATSANFKLDSYSNNRTCSIYATTTEGVTNLIVNSQISKFTFTLPTLTETNFYGWKVQSTEMTASEKEWFNASTGGTLHTNATYSFGTGGNQAIPANDGSTVYFYPIDKAGNVGTPVILKFVDAPLPVITSITKNGFANNSYYNANSSVSINAKYSYGSGTMNIKQIGISDGTNYELRTLASPVTLTAVNQTATISDISLSGLTGTTLEFELITDYTSSVVDIASTLSSLTYDNAGPAGITAYSVSSKATGEADYSDKYARVINSGAKVEFGTNASSLKVTFTSTDGANVAGYALSDTATEWKSELEFDSTVTGAKTIYAKDGLGNISSETITFTKNITVPSISGVSDNSTSVAKAYRSSDILYYAADCGAVEFTVSATSDNGVRGYKLDGGAEQTSSVFNITPSDAATSHIFYAIDNIGNVSAGTTITFTKDSDVSAPATATYEWYKDANTVDSTGYVHTGADGTIYYNSTVINKITFTPTSGTDASGIAGYSSDQINWSATTVTVDDPSGTISIYAKDNVGNIGPALTYSIVKDEAAPSPTLTEGKVTGYTVTAGSIFLGYDREVNSAMDYASNFFTSDLAVSLDVSDTGSGVAGYAITTGTSDSDAPAAPLTFTATTGSITGLTFPDPGYHGYVWLFVKDNVGNVKGYLVANNESGKSGYTWFKQYTGISAANSTLSAGNWGNNAGSAVKSTVTLTVSGLNENYAVSSINLNLPTTYTIDTTDWGGIQDTLNLAFDITSIVCYFNNASSYTPVYNFDSENKKIEFPSPYIVKGENIVITMTATVTGGTNNNSLNWVGNESTNPPLVSGVSVSSITDNGGTAWTAVVNNAAPSPRQTIVGVAVETVKSFFTPKTKRIDIAPKDYSSQKNSPAPAESAVTQKLPSSPVSEKPVASKSASKAAARTKALKSRVAGAEVMKNQGSSVVPENATVMSASPIIIDSERISSDIINIEENAVHTDVVDKQTAPDQKLPLYIVIFTIITGLFIAGVIITSKKIIDKYN